MLGLLLVLACNAAPLAQLDLREERASLLAADSAFAMRASQGLLPAFRDMLDEDVIFLDPGERTLFGKAATLAMLASDGISAAATQGWRAVRVDVSADGGAGYTYRSEEHTSELQSLRHLVCRLLLEKKKKQISSSNKKKKCIQKKKQT